MLIRGCYQVYGIKADKQGGGRMDVEIVVFDEESGNEISSEGELEKEDVSESSDMEGSEQD